MSVIRWRGRLNTTIEKKLQNNHVVERLRKGRNNLSPIASGVNDQAIIV